MGVENMIHVSRITKNSEIKVESELLGIIYLIRVTCYITVEAHRRHPDPANSTVIIHRIIGEL
jgi:hypothetical protein